MNMQLSAKIALREAWVLLKKNAGFIYGISALSFIVFFLLPLLSELLIKDNKNIGFSIGIYFFSSLISTIFTIGWISAYLKMIRGEKPSLKNFIPKFKTLIYYFLTSVLVGLIVIIGIMLFIIPGIIWSIQFSYALNLVIDKNLNPIEALKTSSRMTKGVKWQLIGIGVTFVLVVLIGFLALGLGLLVAIPLTTIAGFIIYNALLPKTNLNK